MREKISSSFIKKYKGSVPKIIKNLFCATFEDEDRIRNIVEELIAEDKLVKGEKHDERISAKKLKSAEKVAKQVERENAECNVDGKKCFLEVFRES